MLKVVSLPGRWDVPSVSPFCLKLETWLRMAQVPHETTHTLAPFGSPKGKAPYVVFDDGEKMGDSALIIARLAREHGVDLDAHLDARAKAEHHALRVMLEERFYFALVYSRWVDERGWAELRGVFSAMPAPLRWFVPALARRAVRRQLWQQGLGRHAPAEIYAFAAADVEAAATLLGQAPFFGGDEPALLDATAWAFFVNALAPPETSPLREAVARHDNLVRYCARGRERFWAEARPELAG